MPRGPPCPAASVVGVRTQFVSQPSQVSPVSNTPSPQWAIWQLVRQASGVSSELLSPLSHCSERARCPSPHAAAQQTSSRQSASAGAPAYVQLSPSANSRHAEICAGRAQVWEGEWQTSSGGHSCPHAHVVVSLPTQPTVSSNEAIPTAAIANESCLIFPSRFDQLTN